MLVHRSPRVFFVQWAKSNSSCCWPSVTEKHSFQSVRQRMPLKRSQGESVQHWMLHRKWGETSDKQSKLPSQETWKRWVRRKEIVKIRAETYETETENNSKNQWEKVDSSKKIKLTNSSKTDKNKNREDTNHQNQDGTEGISTDSADIKKTVRKRSEQLYAQKFGRNGWISWKSINYQNPTLMK